ncbi:MAG: hypothetical protein M9965_00145 [Anaerolineae bacterium]|nr:hypothetical protein [Anaerolineae bacterium]MCO5194019.1 hypothetical protein [Anaerolineae bacterium]
MTKWLIRLGTIALLAASVSACVQLSSPQPISVTTPPPPATSVLQPTATQVDSTTETVTESISTTVPTDTPMPTTVVTEAFTGPDLSLEDGRVYLYPTPRLVAGDQVTFQVYARIPETIRPQDVELQLLIDGELLIDGTLGWRNLADEAIGLYEWIWDTSGMPGQHEIQVVLDPRDVITYGDENPNNNAVELVVDVASAETVSAEWVVSRSDLAILHVVSGSAAERDLPYLADAVDNAIRMAGDRLNMFPPVDVEVYFADRTIGNGGYANTAMVISYPERNYAGGELEQLLVHETVHILDNEHEPDRSFRFLVEGLAVWATGGHYKLEDLDQRAAALYFETTHYVPLTELVENFYPTQHEIGYLEAGSFFKYLVDTYGWQRVRFFYGDLEPVDNSTIAQTMSASMQTHFGKTLQQLENDWLIHLRNQPRDPNALNDLLLTIQYYDTMRLYQQTYDPTAYFLTAWLPTPEVLTERDQTAELARHPTTEMNIWLETMLVAANTALQEGRYDDATALLQSVERVTRFGGVTGDPLATTYLELVRAAMALGYEVRAVAIDGTRATVEVVNSAENTIDSLQLSLRGQEWIALD